MKTTNIYVDIETVGNPEAVALLGEVKPDSRLKDPAKIAASIVEKQQTRIDRAALDVDTLQIVCIGYAVGDDLPVVISAHESTEKAMLGAFWERYAALVQDKPTAAIVGFNHSQFDMPALVRRSQVLGVPYPGINLGKYRHEGLIDLMMELTWHGVVDPKSLSVYCRLFGLNLPEDTTKGSDVAALYAAGDYDTIAAHCRSDVVATRALAHRLGF